jgi:glutaredoxin 3
VVSKLNVVIYTTTSCPYCKMLKDYLGDNNIGFIEKLVDQDEEARDKMAEESGGFMGVPFTVITDDSGKKETIVGFDKGRVNQVLGLD